MTGAEDDRPPRRSAVRAVELAARALPRGDIRRRYEREFVAELYGLDRVHQGRHAFGVLCSIWSLRAAATTEDYTLLEASMGHLMQRRPLLCLLNLHHHWHMEYTDDGGRYVQCTRCGKERRGIGGIPPGAVPTG